MRKYYHSDASTVRFPKVEKNNPLRKGQPAAAKILFGERGRYAVWPSHTRFDAVEWFVADAEHSNSTMQQAEVIRQAASLEKALEGLT